MAVKYLKNGRTFKKFLDTNLKQQEIYERAVEAHRS